MLALECALSQQTQVPQTCLLAEDGLQQFLLTAPSPPPFPAVQQFPHHCLSSNRTVVCGPCGILAKKQHSRAADMEAEVIPRSHHEYNIELSQAGHAVEVGRNSRGCDPGATAQPHAVVKGSYAIKIHSRTIGSDMLSNTLQ